MSDNNPAFDKDGVKIFLDSEAAGILSAVIQNELNRNTNFGEYYQIKDILAVVDAAVKDYFSVPQQANKETVEADMSQLATFNIISRYGEDDIALWTVDISRDDFAKLTKNGAVRISGTFDEVINQLPNESDNDNKLYFIFTENADYEPTVTICTLQAYEGFIDDYSNQGCSVRGPVKDVLYEYMTAYEPEVTVTFKVKEAMAVNNLIDLELCNNPDKEQRRLLEVAGARIEKSMGQCVVPDDEAEQDAEGDLEV